MLNSREHLHSASRTPSCLPGVPRRSSGSRTGSCRDAPRCYETDGQVRGRRDANRPGRGLRVREHGQHRGNRHMASHRVPGSPVCPSPPRCLTCRLHVAAMSTMSTTSDNVMPPALTGAYTDSGLAGNASARRATRTNSPMALAGLNYPIDCHCCGLTQATPTVMESQPVTIQPGAVSRSWPSNMEPHALCAAADARVPALILKCNRSNRIPERGFAIEFDHQFSRKWSSPK